MNTTLTVVAIVLVVAVLGVVGWALLLAPIVVPWRHAKQHPRTH